MEFSGAAMYNEAALQDLFNGALDEPLSWWRMRGQDHLTFGEFVEFLACSPAKVADVPQVVGDKTASPPVAASEAAEPQVAADEAAVSPMAADEAAAHPMIPGLVRKLADTPMRTLGAAGIPRLAPPKAAVPVPEHAPYREPTESTPESAPEPAPFREPTESAPEPATVREPTESDPEPAAFRKPTESTPFREPTEPAPFWEPTESPQELALSR